MKKGKSDSQTSLSDKSGPVSVSDKIQLLSLGKMGSILKLQLNSVDEEPTQQSMKENEIRSLAQQIGIDYGTEKDKYFWFLVQISNLDLPPGWIKEEDPTGEVYYYNLHENITLTNHPMIAKFRSLFNEILEKQHLNRSEIAEKSKEVALKERIKKLEQERESQSPTKKSRESVKLNKAKKFRAAATAIAMTAAFANKIQRSESTNDRPTKSIPEQPQGILDSEKAKDKFKKIKEILERRRTLQEKKVNEVDNLVKTEEILNVCKQYYVEQHGFFHKEPPQSMLDLESFETVDPVEIIEAAKLFNVRSSQAYLFWVLRAYCGLPMPEYWTKMFDANLQREIYYNSCYDVKISVKPCYSYILDLINYLKEEAVRDRESLLSFGNKMTLYDKLGRQYDVDLASMIKDLIEKQNKDRRNYFTYHQKKDNPKDDSQKITKKKKKENFNSNYSDAHFIEIATQLGIDLNTEIHLLMIIEEFVRSKESTETWFFRQSQEGPAFWVDHEQQQAVNRYPHIKELKKVIEETKKKHKNQETEAKKNLKSQFSLIKLLFRRYPEGTARKLVMEEAKNYTEFFMKMKSDGQLNNVKFDTKGYNLTNLVRKIGMQLSKSDIMDLLFYCPFDFTQFVGDEFFSSENYLIKKLHLKSGVESRRQESPGDSDNMELMREGSFHSDVSNDSAKKIRSKIEDSKKLLDLASNIKGLSLDQESKREFMKLLIDFDQKYGDDNILGALEQEITENIQNGVTSTKGLVNSIKSKMTKNNNEKDFGVLFNNSTSVKKLLFDSSKGSTSIKNLLSTFEREENSTHKKVNKDLRTETDSSMKTKRRKKAKGGENSQSEKKTGPKKSRRTKEADEEEEDEYEEGYEYDEEEEEERDEDDDNDDDEEEGNFESSNGEEKHKKGTRSKLKKYQNKENISSRYGGIPRDVKIKKKTTKAVHREDEVELDGLEEEDSNEEYSETLESDEEDIVKDAYIQVSGKKAEMKVRKVPSQFMYDENGKIIFTNKTTQQLLENLADQGAKMSLKRTSQHEIGQNSRLRGSMQNEYDEPISIFGRKSQAFEDHEILYHEIIAEDGERIIVPVNIKRAPKKNRSSSPEEINKSKSPKTARDNTTGKLINTPRQPSRAASHKKLVFGQDQNISNADEGSLPMVIGASYKPANVNQESKSNLPKFDPNVLIESLRRYNVEALDEAYQKEEKKKEELDSMNRLSVVNETKFGDATGLSATRVGLTPVIGVRTGEPLKLPQTYKSLVPGLRNLEMTRPKNSYDRTGKMGAWTHIESLDLQGITSDQARNGGQRSISENMKLHNTTRLTENEKKSMVVEETFYTPFRRGNLGIKRFLEYMGYLNTLVFIKKLDTLVTNFLIKQFTSIQQESLGINFNPEDPTFRKMFKNRYKKLIKQLRSNLLKKKDFLNNIYSKVFNGSDDLPDTIFQSIPNPPEMPRNREEQMDKPPLHQTLMIGKNSELNLNLPYPSYGNDLKNERSLKGSKSQQNLQLPQVQNNKSSQNKFLISRRAASRKSMNNQNITEDIKIRASEETNEYEIHHLLNKSRNKSLLYHQKASDLEKITGITDEYDKENYKHYWNMLGDPLKLESSTALSRIDSLSGIQPIHILLMARRLGLQIQRSEDCDLIWIAYLSLTVQLPQNAEKLLKLPSPKNDSRFQKICNLKFGDHPGDKYFKTVMLYNQMRRNIIFEHMSEESQTNYIKGHAWVKLKEEAGGVYYYNFFTKQKTINLPSNQKEASSKISAILV